MATYARPPTGAKAISSRRSSMQSGSQNPPSQPTLSRTKSVPPPSGNGTVRKRQGSTLPQSSQPPSKRSVPATPVNHQSPSQTTGEYTTPFQDGFLGPVALAYGPQTAAHSVPTRNNMGMTTPGPPSGMFGTGQTMFQPTAPSTCTLSELSSRRDMTSQTH